MRQELFNLYFQGVIGLYKLHYGGKPVSGHSKWATIKRKKGALDAKRGKVFTKIIREITVAARVGGGQIDINPRLRLAVDKAKAVNMPNDNIQRAIKKGTGDGGETVNFAEYTLEGYGPGGVALLCEVMSDNKNRTTPEIRRIFENHGGSMGASGCVAWQFHKQGIIAINRKQTSEEKVMEVAVSAGADDIRDSKDEFEVLTPPDKFHAIKSDFEKQGIALEHAEISMIPQTTVNLVGKDAAAMLKLMEDLEDHDDVQNVYANFDIHESELAEHLKQP